MKSDITIRLQEIPCSCTNEELCLICEAIEEISNLRHWRNDGAVERWMAQDAVESLRKRLIYALEENGRLTRQMKGTQK